ncbi:MAG: ABC transporter substrate-binding protein [Clostridiales bacterium]|nr:ABC transporter substrate-binding protein [Clostridiales bacterium]
MKKLLVTLLSVVMLLCSGVMLAACDSKPVIGVLQFGAHPSLNNCYDGFIQGLEEGGIDLAAYNVKHEDSNFDSATGVAQANGLVSRKAKLILAIATPSAVAAYAAANGTLPVVFCAVSDPAAAGFVKGQTTNLTGSSDLYDFAAQLELIKAFLPQASKVGVLYTESESNSIAQLAALKAAAAGTGLTIIDRGINNANEIPSVTDALINEGVDCLTNLTDNTVVGALQTILAKTDLAGIPIFGSEIEQVKGGCLASVSIDYIDLGRLTGLMAAKILKGEKTADQLDYLYIEDYFNCYSAQKLDELGLTLPDAYAADILDVDAQA